jgi:hypothetical protein
MLWQKGSMMALDFREVTVFGQLGGFDGFPDFMRS